MEWIEPLDYQGFRQQLGGLASTDVQYYEPVVECVLMSKILLIRIYLNIAKL